MMLPEGPGKSLKVALVAMPWSARERPSSALGALAAFVRRERPQHEVRQFYEYVALSHALGGAIYEQIEQRAHKEGEALYAPLLYPQQHESSRGLFVTAAPASIVGAIEASGETLAGGSVGLAGGVAGWFDHAVALLREHLEEVARRLQGFDVVGMTTSFGQLFANLALARRLKEISPETHIVLGGSTVSERVGPSLLSEYPWIDTIIQGEGESPLVALLDAIAQGQTLSTELAGILVRGGHAMGVKGQPFLEVKSLDDLPMPDFDAYVELAEQHDIRWFLPCEGSRGCWWDRTRRTGNARNTCYFCNLNVQWNGYREKSPERVAAEVAYLTQRYRCLDLYFVDNIIRHQGALELTAALRRLKLDLSFMYELRANVRPIELLELSEVGLTSAQVGIEGLSSAYLKRFNKGTTLIQNLQAMKLCAELGISNNSSNILTKFPSTTQEEVNEMAYIIDHYAILYEPLGLSPYGLGLGSTLEVLRDGGFITNVRNRDYYRAMMPREVWERIHLLELDFDHLTQVDWTPLYEAHKRWQDYHPGGCQSLLRYFDGSSFLLVHDLRPDRHSKVVLKKMQREVYLYCMEIRSLSQVNEQFKGRFSADKLASCLEVLVKNSLMFQEGNRYLSLAVAERRQTAAARIREHWAQAQAEETAAAPPAPVPARLPLLATR